MRPSASRSSESGAFKNVVVKISGTDAQVPVDLFSPHWFNGVTLVAVPAEPAELLLREPAKRAAALWRLVAAIPSEMADAEVQVGAELDGDESDRDKTGWVAGFDGRRAPSASSRRASRARPTRRCRACRAHSAYFLVCKAGGGTAATTFHARLTNALRKGKTLDEALESGSEPGPAALRRVAAAGQRNRARILAMAATALGFHTLDTISDNASAPSSPSRGAIPLVDVSTNVLRKLAGVRSVWQYSAGCVDACVSQGLLTASNVAEGFVVFTNANDEFKLNLRNEAASCVVRDAAAQGHARGPGVRARRTSAARATPTPSLWPSALAGSPRRSASASRSSRRRSGARTRPSSSSPPGPGSSAWRRASGAPGAGDRRYQRPRAVQAPGRGAQPGVSA